MAAAVFRMRMPPGSTSGVGSISRSSGLPGWLRTAVSPLGTGFLLAGRGPFGRRPRPRFYRMVRSPAPCAGLRTGSQNQPVPAARSGGRLVPLSRFGDIAPCVGSTYARPGMGLIHVTVTVRRVEGAARAYSADFLVDTGATDSLAPARALSAIGIRPVGRMAYELADGTLHEYDFGLARIEFMGEVTAGRVLFGPDDVEPLLGVTALESVGITIDPASHTLKRLPAIPLK